jgi:hypothetical protein
LGLLLNLVRDGIGINHGQVLEFGLVMGLGLMGWEGLDLGAEPGGMGLAAQVLGTRA